MTGTLWDKPAACCCDKATCLIQQSALDSDKELTDHFNLEAAENFAYHGDPFFAIQVSAAAQIATKEEPHPQPPYPPYAQIEFYGDNIGSQARLIVGGDLVAGVLDTSTAIAAQVTLGDNCSTLELIDLSDDSAITPPLLMWGIDRNEWHRLTLCYDPDTGNAKATVRSLAIGAETYAIFGTYSTGLIGSYAAFGTGPTSVDNVYFRKFYFYRLWYCGDSPYTSDCHTEGDAWDAYYELPTRSYCFRCDPFCEEWTSQPAIDEACLWTVTSGSMSAGVLASPASAATFNQELPARAMNAFSASLQVATDWPDNGVVGDSFTLSVGGGAVTVTETITAIDPVTREITVETTLTGATPGVLTDSYIWSEPGGITLCIENNVVTANETYGTLAAPLASTEISFSISSATDIELSNLWVNALGYVTTSDGTRLECGYCSRPCQFCSDAFPSGVLVEISGLEAFQSLVTDTVEWEYYCANDLGECPDELELPARTVTRNYTPSIDCDSFNTAFYLEATVNTSCQAYFDAAVDSGAQRSCTITCPNPLYPWYVDGGGDCQETPLILYTNVDYVEHVDIICDLRKCWASGLYSPAEAWGVTFALKAGFSLVLNHIYLRVAMRWKINNADWGAATYWYQLWLTDLGTSPVPCLEFNQKELEWVGNWDNGPRRYCGGGWIGGLTDVIVSASIAKVTSL